MRKLVALASLNDQGTLDEDVVDAMVTLAHEYAEEYEGVSEASSTQEPESEDGLRDTELSHPCFSVQPDNQQRRKGTT
jgi:hypothetical protein